MFRRPLALVAAAMVVAVTGCGTPAPQVSAEAETANARLAQQQGSGQRPRVLFIRGAKGTAGTSTDGPDDKQLSDIADLDRGGNGYGLWAKALVDAGYDVSQLDETGTLQNKQKVALDRANLSQYKVVIFGSNNATYNDGDAKIVGDYVKGGGGVLFMSDLNWATAFDIAQKSDNAFLSQFGINVQQDNGEQDPLTKADFVVADHPALEGVSNIASVGTSACTITGFTPPDVRAKVVVKYKTKVQTAEQNGQRITRAPTGTDGALVTFEPGRGRGVCLYDRDQFFNNSIKTPDHERLATNLIDWLSGKLN